MAGVLLSIMVMQDIAPAAGSAGRSARPAADSPAAITARLRSRSTFIGAAADKAFMWNCCTASEVTFSNTIRLAQRSIRPAGRSSSWVGDQQVRPVAAETGDGDPAQLALLSPEPAPVVENAGSPVFGADIRQADPGPANGQPPLRPAEIGVDGQPGFERRIARPASVPAIPMASRVKPGNFASGRLRRPRRFGGTPSLNALRTIWRDARTSLFSRLSPSHVGLPRSQAH